MPAQPDERASQPEPDARLVEVCRLLLAWGRAARRLDDERAAEPEGSTESSVA